MFMLPMAEVHILLCLLQRMLTGTGVMGTESLPCRPFCPFKRANKACRILRFVAAYMNGFMKAEDLAKRAGMIDRTGGMELGLPTTVQRQTTAYGDQAMKKTTMQRMLI